jgi:uridine kinase
MKAEQKDPMKRSFIGGVRKRSGEVVPFDQERITFAIYKAAASVGGTNMRRAKRLSDRVAMTLEDRTDADATPSVEEVQDMIEEVLITGGHVKTARSFIVYRENRRTAREQATGASRAPHGPTPYRTLWDTLAWNTQHGCCSIAGLNDLIARNQIGRIVAESEARFDQELTAVAEQVAGKAGQVKLVIVAGPSSSGKTTTTHRLSQKLRLQGLELVAINVDNYFRSLEFQPRDERGDYDYETPEAIDLPLLNDHLERLLAGKKIESPIFDFQQGRRVEETLPMRLGKNQVALLDTLHGLYKGLTAKIPEEVKYKVYIEALAQTLDHDNHWIRWTDVRLLRRMARDKVHRNVTPDQTLNHWHYVRRSEKKHIIPYVGDADFVLNGTFPYEIPLYRPILLEHVENYLAGGQGTPDGVERAQRIQGFLSRVQPLGDSPDIPRDSIVREFIGGGSVQ